MKTSTSWSISWNFYYRTILL